MTKEFIRETFGWGIILWLFGYILGFILFPFVPSSSIGWIITPFGILATVWVLSKKIQPGNFKKYLWLSLIWTFLAIVFDYVFLVKLLKPADGYYKIDVYLYYLLTFLMPIFYSLKKSRV